MPNLRQFIIEAQSSPSISPFSATLFDGCEWQRLLTSHTPHLDTINFFLHMINPSPFLDMNAIVHSFQYFVTKFNDFHVAISRSRFSSNHQRKIKPLLICLKVRICVNVF
jgi:hypothetical protein